MGEHFVAEIRIVVDYEFLDSLIELSFIDEDDSIVLVTHHPAKSQIELTLTHV